jgi:hypothetical protein
VTAVAALFVERGGVYYGLPGVDPWDRERDARLYDGPHPVVAHPPCDRWCQMAPVNQARYGHKIGDDDGCFVAASNAVEKWGGVLEHPAFSLAWAHWGLPTPPISGGWIKTFSGGWTCHVEQRHYGHRARKATWLYCYGLLPPPLTWGAGPDPEAWISTDRPRSELAERGIAQLSKKEARATTPAFRDLLLSIARSAQGIEAPSGGETLLSGSTEGESPTPQRGDAP